MAKIKKTTEDKKELEPLKSYSRQELIQWDQKFKGMSNNDRGVLFGAYTKTFPDIYGGRVAVYSVRPSEVREFENLVSQLSRMNYGEHARNKQYEQVEHQQDWFSKIA